MKKLLIKTWISITLFFDLIGFTIRELFRGAQVASKDIFESKSIEVSKEQQVQELSEQEAFEFQTGVIGHYQTIARKNGDTQSLKDMEQYLFDMAAAYKSGNVKKFIEDQQKGTEIMWNVWYENEETLLIHKKEDKIKHINKNGKETDYTRETAKAAGLLTEKHIKGNNP